MRSVLDPVMRYVSGFDPRTRWLAWGRTVLALGQLSALLLTPAKYLFPPVLGQTQAPECSNVLQQSSIYCLGGSESLATKQICIILVLLVVASGVYPRWTSVLHFWASLSIGVSIALPDGGESVARIATLLLIPVCAGDSRRWQWRKPAGATGPRAQAWGFAFIWALRAQMSFIYADSAISKFGVADWANGTAEYYIVRDPLFGSSGPLGGLMHWGTSFALGTLTLTWGALVAELALAFLMLTPRRGKRLLIALDTGLHGMIILSMGLWSFGLVMIGAAVAASTPMLGRFAPSSPLGDTVEGISHKLSLAGRGHSPLATGSTVLKSAFGGGRALGHILYPRPADQNDHP